MMQASCVEVGMHVTIDSPVGTPGARVFEVLEVHDDVIGVRRVAYRWINTNDPSPSKARWTNLDGDQVLDHWYTDGLTTVIDEIPV